VALDVDRIAISGEWIRHAPHHSDLLGRSAEPTDGRWQRGDVVRGLYIADEPDTAVAEWYRYLAERGLPPSAAVPHDHHIWRIDLAVADLSTSERLAAVGLQPPRPTRRDWPLYQQVGEALWRDGWRGLLAPSAARSTAQAICIFCDDWPPTGCTPLRAIEITDAPPPPTGLTT
jgi:RES domain-containing protein